MLPPPQKSFPRYSQIEPNLIGLSRREQYEILLNTSEWYYFRETIVERDNRRCKKCNRAEGLMVIPLTEEEIIKEKNDSLKWTVNFWEDLLNKKMTEEEIIKLNHDLGPSKTVGRVIGDVVLNAHHKLYYYTSLPWQYKLDELETLCVECHKQIHQENKIYTYYDEKKELRMENKICDRCGGSGYIKEFKNIEQGICFKCLGHGILFSEQPIWVKVN